ncbi:AGAP002461-PA-like protein [Anopheles sinensis]|uniref:AGAP002461-PA-like protein n=1 Tax=Anopheles sinensis TaxID=74873 RepID=A0A084WRE8_ANOSI|nr:AGAP002461-PA-like protein [Anopheles sinensis]
MVGSTGTLMTMRLVRSKLRKREESSTSPSTVWVFPPLPPQPNIYNASSQDAFVHNEKTGFKGLKRQLSGRFKRLVSRKAHEPAPVIPPELKPQLKTIYVY